MASHALDKLPKIVPRVAAFLEDDAEAAATVMVKAMLTHGVRLRMHPLANRPPVAVQERKFVLQFKDMLAAGHHRIFKAVLDDEGGKERVVGIADWVLYSEKRAVVPEGFSPAPLREPTQEDRDGDQGVDFEMRQRVNVALTEMRDKTMGDSEYWYLALLFVDPAYQRKGVAQALLRWGLEQADEHSPALEVYLASTEDGFGLYKKNDFDVVGWSNLPDEKSVGGALRWACMKRSARTK